MADYQPAGSPWVCALDVSNLQNTTFPSNCKNVFMRKFLPMFNNMLACFFACLFTLISVVLYYMFRPSEAYNNSPLVELLKAFTLDVRRQIREEMHSAGPPEEPFENRALECEVFFKAKFLAANEAEEQKNIEFYIWYQSRSCFCCSFSSFNFARICAFQFAIMTDCASLMVWSHALTQGAKFLFLEFSAAYSWQSLHAFLQSSTT